jgi:plasmid stabilization system protein ParE
MKVVLSDEAKADLRAIGLFIDSDNKTRARSFVRALQAKARDTGDLPPPFLSFHAMSITASAAVPTAII